MDEKQEKIVPDIDYEKSIAKQKLVYNRKGYFVVDYILSSGVMILLITSMLYAGYFALKDESNYFLFPISLLAEAWLVVSLFFLNKLVKVNGKGIVRNKEDVMNTLKHFYTELTFEASEENIIRDVKPTFWGPGRDLIVLLDGNDVYFHKASLMKGSSINPASGFTDNLKAKEIAKYFQELQAKSETQSN